MPFGHDAKPGETRIYEYGVPRTAVHHGLLTGEHVAIDEMRGQVRLWNWLVEVERGYRAARDVLLAPYPPQPVDVVGKDGKTRKQMRRILPLETKDALDALNRRTADALNAACTTSGLYSWHYTDVKLRWIEARKKFDPPKFHRWDGNEKVWTYIPGGLPVSQMWNGNTLVRFERGGRDGDVLVYLRIQSDERRRPVWMALPIRLHRPLPPESKIASVTAVREVIGPNVRWKVLVGIARRGGWRTFDGPRAGSVGVDVGWRQLPCPCEQCKVLAAADRPRGLRVAAWHDDTGRSGEVVLFHGYLQARDEIDGIQGDRALAFNAVISDLRAYLAGAPVVPEWLAEETRYCHQWKRYGRLVTLLRKWDERRFDGDDRIVTTIREWTRRDHWAWLKVSEWLDRLLRDRRERYRLFASWVANTYERVMLEDFDLSVVARVKKNAAHACEGGTGAELPGPVRHNRQLAGVYQLRLALKNACGREGIEVVLREAAGTTMICSLCGSIEHFDHARELRHTCGACGHEWDQDQNASLNVLRGVSI